MIDILLIVSGILCLVVGIIGNFLPVIPGVILSWVGLLLIYLSPSIFFDGQLLLITLLVAALVFIIDFIVPALAVKTFGGSKSGMYGSALGMIVGFFLPLPFMLNLVIGAFLGAMTGELIKRNKNYLKASVGSVIGLFASTIIKVVLSTVYLIFGLNILWNHILKNDN